MPTNKFHFSPPTRDRHRSYYSFNLHQRRVIFYLITTASCMYVYSALGLLNRTAPICLHVLFVKKSGTLLYIDIMFLPYYILKRLCHFSGHRRLLLNLLDAYFSWNIPHFKSSLT